MYMSASKVDKNNNYKTIKVLVTAATLMPLPRT